MDPQRFAATGSAYDRPEPSYDAAMTHVERGSPMGELLRRYWHPVYKSDKLTDRPVKVKALCDEIILFRKPDGSAGAVYPRCVHRGTDLIWGKVVAEGIRCCYHGWVFDTDGTCMAQPCEANNGGKGRNAVRQPWYPVEELYGLIFIYMGPLDRKPPLPRYDLLEQIPDGYEIIADDNSIPSAGAGYMPCNWLQHHENGMDPAHVPILHENQFPPILAKSEMINEFHKLPDRIHGRGLFKLGPTMLEMNVEMPIPTVRVIPDPRLAISRPDGKSDSVAWTLPTDNDDTITFTAIVKPKDQDFEVDAELYDGKRWIDMSFEEHQRNPGDFEAQTGQGVITFHSEEHLVSSDKGVVFYRRMMQAAMKDVAEGRDPPLSFGPASIYIETVSSAKMVDNPDHVVEQGAASPAPAPPAGAPVAGLDGTWKFTLDTPMGSQSVIATIAVDGDRFTGRMTGEEGETEIDDGQVSGATLKWTTGVTKPMTMTLEFQASIDGDDATGSFKPGPFPAGPMTGVRIRIS